MLPFSEYCEKYKTVRMRREDGILELKLHTDGGPMQFTLQGAHRDLEGAFLDVGRDPDNEIVIVTGTGDEFIGPQIPFGGDPARRQLKASAWDPMQKEGKGIIMNFLNIEVPVISAINGPATRHAEIPLMADIVLASTKATFQDSAHFQGGMVPGDGINVVFPMLMGTNRARYFLMTGQVLTAAEAKEFGLVNEVLPDAELLPRAWEWARTLQKQPALVRRFTRMLLTQPLREEMHRMLGFGFALEGLGRMKEDW